MDVSLKVLMSMVSLLESKAEKRKVFKILTLDLQLFKDRKPIKFIKFFYVGHPKSFKWMGVLALC
jgi:hypothetical protein